MHRGDDALDQPRHGDGEALDDAAHHDRHPLLAPLGQPLGKRRLEALHVHVELLADALAQGHRPRELHLEDGEHADPARRELRQTLRHDVGVHGREDNHALLHDQLLRGLILSVRRNLLVLLVGVVRLDALLVEPLEGADRVLAAVEPEGLHGRDRRGEDASEEARSEAEARVDDLLRQLLDEAAHRGEGLGDEGHGHEDVDRGGGEVRRALLHIQGDLDRGALAELLDDPRQPLDVGLDSRPALGFALAALLPHLCGPTPRPLCRCGQGSGTCTGGARAQGA
mmetsp:Transcript_41294/g.116876  ORF Transcript_41294/g.116876 Transcript_41294/m.116876 type:complete len:283 (+) Transcript_41294:420-1268(+)